jgi:thioredoxin 1
MLETSLKHVESNGVFKETIANNRNVMLCCGRMGPMCVPVYDIMENIQSRYPHVCFCDMDFDGPAADNVRRMPQVRSFLSLPFTIYFHDGAVVAATTGIQTEDQIAVILDEKLASTE